MLGWSITAPFASLPDASSVLASLLRVSVSPLPHTSCPPSRSASFMRKCILSLEFVYLMIMTFAGTWFGIGVFYTILCVG